MGEEVADRLDNRLDVGDRVRDRWGRCGTVTGRRPGNGGSGPWGASRMRVRWDDAAGRRETLVSAFGLIHLEEHPVALAPPAPADAATVAVRRDDVAYFARRLREAIPATHGALPAGDVASAADWLDAALAAAESAGDDTTEAPS